MGSAGATKTNLQVEQTRRPKKLENGDARPNKRLGRSENAKVTGGIAPHPAVHTEGAGIEILGTQNKCNAVGDCLFGGLDLQFWRFRTGKFSREAGASRHHLGIA